MYSLQNQRVVSSLLTFPAAWIPILIQWKTLARMMDLRGAQVRTEFLQTAQFPDISCRRKIYWRHILPWKHRGRTFPKIIYFHYYFHWLICFPKVFGHRCGGARRLDTLVIHEHAGSPRGCSRRLRTENRSLGQRQRWWFGVSFGGVRGNKSEIHSKINQNWLDIYQSTLDIFHYFPFECSSS